MGGEVMDDGCDTRFGKRIVNRDGVRELALIWGGAPVFGSSASRGAGPLERVWCVGRTGEELVAGADAGAAGDDATSWDSVALARVFMIRVGDAEPELERDEAAEAEARS